MDAREASRHQSLWDPHIGTLLNQVRRHGPLMTQDELEELTRRYLTVQSAKVVDQAACVTRCGVTASSPLFARPPGVFRGC